MHQYKKDLTIDFLYNGGIDILRIIAGTARGHRLKTLKGMSTRPTTDRVKESVFNILMPYISNCDVLDLFAGTGNLGIEALSRGAASAVFSDISRECCEIIKENLIFTKMHEKAEIINSGYGETVARLATKGKNFDLVFLDPPYNKNFIQETLKLFAKNDIIKSNGIVAAEHHIDDTLPEAVGRLKLTRKQSYGDTAVTFYILK